MQLLAPELEPHTAAAVQRHRLPELAQPQQVAEEAPGLGFAARRGGELYVVKTDDRRVVPIAPTLSFGRGPD